MLPRQMSVEANVVRVWALRLQVAGGRHSRKFSEIVNEVRLIRIPGSERNARPIDVLACGDVAHDRSESKKTAISLGCHADLVEEKVTEPAAAQRAFQADTDH